MAEEIDELEAERQKLAEEARIKEFAKIIREVRSDNIEEERKRLSALHGADSVWDSDQLREQFEVVLFLAPFAVVVRKSDGAKGSVCFQPSPRLYFAFQEG